MLSLSALKPHQLLTQALNFLLVLSTAFMLWKGLSVAADSKSPIVVVLSGSMEPAFQRGDLLFLWNRDGLLPSLSELFPNPFATATTYGSDKGKAALVRRKEIKVGEIVVYEVRGKEIPIVHRVVRRFGGCDDDSEDERRARGGLCDKPTHLLTKGDNNAADDTELYARGQGFLDRDRDVVGSVVGFVPFVGYGTILLSEYPWLKTAMLGLMGLTVVLQRE